MINNFRFSASERTKLNQGKLISALGASVNSCAAAKTCCDCVNGVDDDAIVSN